MNNIDHIGSMWCSDGKPWILTSVLMRLRHPNKHCPRTNTLPHANGNPKCHWRKMPPTTWQQHQPIRNIWRNMTMAQDVGLTSKLPRAHSDQASTGCSGTSWIDRGPTAQARAPKGSTANVLVPDPIGHPERSSGPCPMVQSIFDHI